MGKIGSDRAYPFRHRHKNHFPPPPSSDSNNDHQQSEDDLWWCEHPYQLSLSPLSEDEEVSVIFRRPSEIDREKEQERRLVHEPSHTMSSPHHQTTKQTYEPLMLPALCTSPAAGPPPPVDSPTPPPPPAPTPPPLHTSIARNKPKPLPPITPTRSNSPPLLLPPNLYSPRNPYNGPPTPSTQTPQNVTSLLTDVLSIMNSIMSQQDLVASENELLDDLTELVVILQQEAEEILMMADLVYEFGDEVEGEGEVESCEMFEGLEAWAEDLGLGFDIAGLDSGIEDCRGVGDDEGLTRGWEEVCGETGCCSERRKERDIKGRGLGHDREDSLDSAVGMELPSEDTNRDDYAGELGLSLCKSREWEKTAEKRPEEGKSKSKQVGSRDQRIVSEKDTTPGTKQVRFETGVLVGSTKSRKGKEKNSRLQFRDSGIDLPCPGNAFRRKESERKS